MSQQQRYAFVDFAIADQAAFDRLATVANELKKQKTSEAIREEDHWLPYFTAQDRAEFSWFNEVETELWNLFWFSTPLPDRHSHQMPTPPWDFGSMIDAIMDGEYELIRVRKLTPEQARFEIDPYAFPYGGMDAVRTLVRAFGHKITGFEDGTGYISGDPQRPRWNSEMPPFKLKASIFDRFKRR